MLQWLWLVALLRVANGTPAVYGATVRGACVPAGSSDGGGAHAYPNARRHRKVAVQQ